MNQIGFFYPAGIRSCANFDDAITAKTGNMRFALDNYRRFISMFGSVVLSIDKDLFEDVISKIKAAKRIKQDSSLHVNDLKEIVKR